MQVELDFVSGGTTTTVGSVTQTVDVLVTPTVAISTFDFPGISLSDVIVLNPGDLVVLRITNLTPTASTFCLVNEFPLGGTDSDASRVVLQTGPLLTLDRSVVVISDPVNGTTNPKACLLYTSPSPRDQRGSRMPSSA